MDGILLGAVPAAFAALGPPAQRRCQLSRVSPPRCPHTSLARYNRCRIFNCLRAFRSTSAVQVASAVEYVKEHAPKVHLEHAGEAAARSEAASFKAPGPWPRAPPQTSGCHLHAPCLRCTRAGHSSVGRTPASLQASARSSRGSTAQRPRRAQHAALLSCTACCPPVAHSMLPSCRAETTPEERASQAAIDEALALATGEPAPIRREARPLQRASPSRRPGRMRSPACPASRPAPATSLPAGKAPQRRPEPACTAAPTWQHLHGSTQHAIESPCSRHTTAHVATACACRRRPARRQTPSQPLLPAPPAPPLPVPAPA